MTTYATVEELQTGVSSTYAGRPEIADAGEAQKLLDDASRLINQATMYRAEPAYASEVDNAPDPTPYRDALRDATIAQIEFWLEVGPEHDVAGLRGSVVAGRLQVHPVAGTLAPRAKRYLREGRLYWAGAAIG